MSKTSYYNYRLINLFPPNDEYSATMARICILWEDFVTESTGGSATSISEMDGHSAQWRRLYFLRRSIGTVHEIRQAFSCLSAQEEFRKAFDRRPKPDQDRYNQSFKILRKHERQIRKLRNTIAGGHVDQSAVKDALKKIHPDVTGIFQQGETYKDIRFKFVHPIALQILFSDDKATDAEGELKKLLNFMHEVVRNALRMVEFAYSIYIHERRITPL